MAQADAARRLEKLLAKFPRAKVGFLGDFCVDVYWDLHGQGEPSLETGLRPNLVPNGRYSPGGGGNVLANLAAAGNHSIVPYGFVGDEPFGFWLQLLLTTLLAECKGFHGLMPLRTVSNWKPSLKSPIAPL